jgi:hypothetical protein
MKKILSILFLVFQFQWIIGQVQIVGKDTFVCIHNLWINKDSILVTPFDSLDLVNQQIINNDFAFLINDSTYYDCKVLKISKLTEGYTIGFYLKIGWRDVFAQVVTTNEKNKHFKKIKVGNTYKIKLKRYFKYPFARSIEYPSVYDVMLGNNLIGVLSTGNFCYLFVSPNLDGLSFMDSTIVDKMEMEKKKKKQSLQEFILCFVKAITFQEDSNNIKSLIDSTLLIESLKKYHVFLINRSPDKKSQSKPIPRRVPFRDWTFKLIDTSNFNTFFWGMLKEDYNLPKSKKMYNDFTLCRDDILIEILYYKYPLYTIKIKWKLPLMDYYYTVIITIKEDNEKYKITGFNRVWKIIRW